jgi:heparinase II/III-like protein
LSSLTTKIKKLKGLKMDELSVRVAQQVAILSERSGLSRQASLPDDDQFLGLLKRSDLNSTSALVEHLRLRTQPHFFPAFTTKELTVSEYRRRWPNAEKEILENADRIAEGTFNLLGLRELKLGKEIDWHLEPLSGKRTPLVHWSQLNYLDVEVAGDKKVTWELNRHQYFLTLGRAHWLTGDERYAEIFVAHVTSWMDQNPPKLGINWASSLEIAFRSISWLWALKFFAESPSLSAEVVVRMLKFLYLNASHLETYLSTYFSPNTHLTGEALGLFYIGLLLPEFNDAARWRDLGLEILESQLSRHVQPDGVYFEQSSYYHRYTADFYIHLAILLRRNDMALPRELEPKLGLLLDHLMYITRPDGTTPFFGDDDGGRLVMLDHRAANDFRAVLSTGAVLFNRPDYKFVAGEPAEETLWLLGPEGLQAFDELEGEEPAKKSVAFPDGGCYVMRDGWSPAANYLLFDCGPHGWANCGHAHADALAIEVAANGKTALVDPGTFTYTGGKELRDWFRGSTAHNTVTVDRESSSTPADTFSWKTRTACEPLAWIEHDRFTYVSGRHNGYEQLGKSDPRPGAGAHTRSILFLKNDYWLLQERINLTGPHRIDQWFHFDSSASEDLLNIVSFAENGAFTTEEGWVSHCYGERTPAPVRVFSATTEGDFEITTFLLPHGSTSTVVEQIDVTGGRGFEVNTEHSRDLVLIRDRSARLAQMASVVSDFDYAWMRFTGAEQSPAEIVLLGGQNLELGGTKIVESAERVEQLYLKLDEAQKTYVRN